MRTKVAVRFLASLILFVSTKAAFADCLSFAAPQSVSAGGLGPTRVAAADFNRDGKTDIAVLNSMTGEISLLFGHGDGTFENPVTTMMPADKPYDIATSDLNGDAIPDLVVNYGNKKKIVVEIGKGDGTFSERGSYALEFPGKLSFADFTGDGVLDIAISSATNLFYVLPGKGDGTFGAVITTRTMSSPGPATATDVNGDGKLDFIGVQPDSYLITLIGAGDGTFAQTGLPRYTNGVSPLALALADFDRDGIDDAVVLHYDTHDLVLLRGTGGGAFGTPVTVTTNLAQGEDLSISDFNLDGKPDVAVLNAYSNDRNVGADGIVSLFIGKGDGTFATLNLAAGLYASGFGVSDFNRDGKPDIAVANFGANTVSILMNTGTCVAPRRRSVRVR
jgi:hypothetical protein